MIQGLYSAAAGMLGQIDQQDALSNNLANSNTSGFKRSSVSFTSHLSSAEGIYSNFGAAASCALPTTVVSKDSTPGIIEDTTNPTNLAINGPGSFVVSSAKSIRLTRGGDFRLDDSGRLVTQEGDAVMGQNGPIHVGGSNWSIDSDGVVRVNGQASDRLRIVDSTEDGSLPASRQYGRIAQGKLERSNVNAIKEMVAMISGMRAYEANQKMVQSIDQILDKAINVIGRTA